MDIHFRTATPNDQPTLETIRSQAFEPVFASFRKLLGDEIYKRAQKSEDDAQGELLESLLADNPDWEVCVAELNGEVAGFVSFQCNHETKVGEIGLNAVKPSFAGNGIGQAMYEHAIAEMKKLGMRVATVATGADESHAPARRAYEKAGFNAAVPSVWLCRTLD